MAEIEERVVWLIHDNLISGFPAKPYRESAAMAQMTMIARVVDGLPLVGTMQDDEQVRN